MKRRFVVLVLTLVMIVSTVLSGCGPTPEPQVIRETVVVTEQVEVPKEVVVEKEVAVEKEVTKVVEKEVVKEVMVTPTPTVPAVKRLDVLRVAQFGNPASLNCPSWGTQDSLDIAQHFGEPLFRFDRQGNIGGVIVESWESDSPTDWTLHIRKGIKFHDPEYGELTAEDVVASLQSCFSPDARMLAVQPGAVAGMELEQVDDYTVRATFPEPGVAGLPNSWALTVITSKKYLEQVGDQWTRRPMGTGPYRFVEWVPNLRIVGERFEDYWGQDPGVERIVWRIIPDAFTRKSEFLTGGLEVLPFMMADWLPDVEANPDVRVEPTLSSRFIMIVLPVKQSPYSDIRVRKALNYAVNKQEIVEQLFQGVGAMPLTGVVHPMLPEADPDREGYPYDPEMAKQLLDEARADGVEIGTLTLYAPNDRYNMDKEMGEAVAGYWRALGLEVEYVPESRTTLFPRAQALEMKDPVLFGVGNPELKPDAAMTTWLQTRTDPPSRGSEYAVGPPEWDAMIAQLGSMPSGDPETTKLARELDVLWTDYAPWVFLINYVDLYGVSNKIDWKPFSAEMRYFFDVKLLE